MGKRNPSAPRRAPEPERLTLARPVFFVGFMGAGKTSVARRLARSCRVASVDMDTYIERREGKRVKDIFAESGEAGFRAIETEVLRELGAKPGNIGFKLPAMGKDQLFKTVIADGVLPRKTFSMGHAEDKRYYVEGRKIR